MRRTKDTVVRMSIENNYNKTVQSEYLPLSAGQEAIWLASKMTAERNLYNVHFVWDIPESLDLLLFKHCLDYLHQHHDALRTTYHLVGSTVSRKIHKDIEPNYQVINLTSGGEVELNDMLDWDFSQGYEMDKEVPVKLRVYRREGKPSVFAWFQHHICTDLWSAVKIITELKTLYHQALRGESFFLPAIERSFDDFIFEQTEFIASQCGQKQREFVLSSLKGYEPCNNLPFDCFPSAQLKQESGYLPFELNEEDASSFTRLCRKNKVLQFNGFLALFHLLLHRLSGDTDITTCAPTAGRNRSYGGVQNYFVNPVLIRLKYDEASDFTSFLKNSGSHIKQVLRNRDYPLAKLARGLGDGKNTVHTKLCNTSFVWECVNSFEKGSEPLVSWPSLTERNWDMGELGVWRRHLRKTQSDEFDITFIVYKFGDKLFGGIEYNAALFKPETIKVFADSYNSLLHSAVTSPNENIDRLSLIKEDAKMHQILSFNDTKAPYDKSKSLHHLIERYANHTPDATALVFKEDSLTYAELNERTNQLSRYLVKLGVKTDSLVGICLPRSQDMYIALIAILKAGGAYLPLDPNYPMSRLQHIADESNIQLCISQSTLVDAMPECEVPILMDQIQQSLDTFPKENVALTIDPEQLAYVMFTSGSTGKPKGVGITHANLASLIISVRQMFDCSPALKVLQYASLNFDTSVLTMTWALSNGGTLCVCPDSALMGKQLLSIVNQYGVNAALLPPSLLSQYRSEDIPSLLQLMVGGEVCSQKLAAEWSQGRSFYNGYGPTESTVWATCALVDGSCTPPIGKPVANTQAYILDKCQNPLPIGMAGELCIGGDGVARGYLNRPELTAERFIPNPFPGTSGERLYRSGDLVRYRNDGQIEFLGRIDDQVKIRGFRIEPGEVEAICLLDSSIKEALVTTFEQAGSAQLVAYVVPHDIDLFTVDNFKERLRKSLPDYMVPTFVIALSAFPLAPNDKIDRRALPDPTECFAKKYDPQDASALEKIIIDIWSEVLGLEHIPLNTNFFDLGGHSLKVVEAYEKLPSNIRGELELIDLYQYTTVASLAENLGSLVYDGFHAEQDDSLAELRALHNNENQDIAIIATAMRVPGAETPEGFWQNLCEGKEGIREFTREELLHAGELPDIIDKPYYVNAKGVVDNIENFDADFFGMTPREAQITDPQQRQFLECAWEAMERAGYVGELECGAVGVFAGVGQNRYYNKNILSHPELEESLGEMTVALGNSRDFLATRVAYKLHLLGPALTVQTACSTSLVAVHTAAQALLNGECDMALAGGVSLGNLCHKGYLHVDGMIGSPDGHTRTFDAEAGGTVASQGSGVVLLKPLAQAKADNDPIIAVIKGSATNNDGSDKAGFTAPSISGQSDVIRQALNRADLSADSIGYVEAHGTATTMGDPIEVASLTKAYRQDTADKQFCALGSAKSNLGHLDTAAGVTGLIKAAMVVQQGKIPPTLHYRSPNPQINFSDSPFFVNNTLIPFPEQHETRRAAVSAFGLGGTNVHTIVEAFENHDEDILKADNSVQLLVLSGDSPKAVIQSAGNLAEHVSSQKHLLLQDVAHTLRVGRRAFDYRVCVLAHDRNNLIEKLLDLSVDNVSEKCIEPHRAVFLFPGQGVHYTLMGSYIYESDENFRVDMDLCHSLLKVVAKKHGVHFSDGDIYAETERLQEVELAPILVFILEYCISLTLLRTGIAPSSMLGHSAGEYVAATLAGVFSIEQTIELLLVRCQLMQSTDVGAMLSLALPAEDVARYIAPFPEISLAASNAGYLSVVSGPTKKIALFEEKLKEINVECSPLNIQRACHSSMLDPILPAFREQLQSMKLNKPSKRFVSSLTGDWISDEQAVDPEYWVNHLRKPVNFTKAVSTLLDEGFSDFIEVGPGRVLSSLTRRCAADHGVDVAVSAVLDRHSYESEGEAWLSGLGELWQQAYPISWSDIMTTDAKRVVLPTYPFQRERHWIEVRAAHNNFSAVKGDGENYGRRASDGGGFTRRAGDVVLGPGAASETSNKVESETPKIDEQQTVVAGSEEVLQGVYSVWRSTLGVNKIKPRDSYFKLGGDSLLAVRALTQLSKQFDIKLPPQVMLEYPSAKELAAYIELLMTRASKLDAQLVISASVEELADGVAAKPLANEMQPKASSHMQRKSTPVNLSTLDEVEMPTMGNVVRLQAGVEGNAALVLVHPVGGEVYYYQDLCKNLPEEMPVYAVQSPGLLDGGQAYESVKEMATVYLAEVKDRLIGDNFILGGASFGGLVALEMAHQSQQVDGVALPLVMIDTPTPYAIKPYSLFRSIDVFDYLLKTAFAGQVKIDLESLAEQTLEVQIEKITEACAEQGIVLPPLFTGNMIETWMVHQQALIEYNVPDYEGSVLYLRHTEITPNFPQMLHRDWLRNLLGDFSVKAVPGNHITMNFGKNAEQLAKEINAFAEQVNVDLVVECLMQEFKIRAVG